MLRPMEKQRAIATKSEVKMKKLISTTILIMVLFSIVPIKSSGADSQYAVMVKTAGGNLNVRESYSASAKIITSIKNGTYVTALGESGDYTKVEYAKGKYGYCHSDYLKSVTSAQRTVNVTSGSLNVRSGEGLGYSVIGTLSRGDSVLVISSNNNWSKILYRGSEIGFVSSSYLSTAYKRISLNVPSFKQTDSRWASVKIGSSGKTIAQIGCATTAIAMIESYRSGSVIYPDAMSKKLTYSSTGNVYWPSDYTTVTSSSGYLAKIYNQLQSGKPVLFGAKTNSGSQHWVVITSFTGGNTLNAADFTINDPGSSKRTNLGQLLSEYPNFYKMMHC